MTDTAGRERLREALPDDDELRAAFLRGVEFGRAEVAALAHDWASGSGLREALINHANGLHNIARASGWGNHSDNGWRRCKAEPCLDALVALSGSSDPEAQRAVWNIDAEGVPRSSEWWQGYEAAQRLAGSSDPEADR